MTAHALVPDLNVIQAAPVAPCGLALASSMSFFQQRQRAHRYPGTPAGIYAGSGGGWFAGMKLLFPDCTILRERFLDLTKSCIAVRLSS